MSQNPPDTEGMQPPTPSEIPSISQKISGLHRAASTNIVDNAAPTSASDTDEVEAKEEVHETKEATAWYKEAVMVKRIVIFAIAVAVVYLGYLGYKKWQTYHDPTSGEIYSDDLTPGSKTRSGETSNTVATPRNGTPATPSTVTIPAGDSQAANAPNGQVYSGNGKFQIYRQGNLTWRVNTDTGESCILFATPDEWRKPIVYNHGCNAS